MRDLLVQLLGKDGRRVMELKTLSNAELFERWRRELGFRYRTERPRKEAIRFAGLFEKFLPKFVKRYVDLGPEVVKALQAYKEEVKAGSFPAEAHIFGGVSQEEMEKLYP